jgi:hypothetical protein
VMDLPRHFTPQGRIATRSIDSLHNLIKLLNRKHHPP